MPIELLALAATVVGKILVPFLKKGAETVADEVTSSVGNAAADHATKVASGIWGRIKGAFDASDKDRATVEQFEQHPEAVGPLLQVLLKEKMEHDHKLAAEIQQLLEAKSPDGSGDVIQIFGQGGVVDARYAEISGGIVAGNIGTYIAEPGVAASHSVPPKPPADPTG